MGTLQEPAEQNPNIRRHYDEFREQRSENAESQTDYQAFRQYLNSVGAPDPAELEVDDFHRRRFQGSAPGAPLGRTTSMP